MQKVKLNRREAPVTHDVRDLALPHTTPLTLDNGLVVQVLDFPGQEVLKLEVIFRAGRPDETKRVTARATAALLREGTLRRSGAEVAEHFDFYGASMTNPGSLDYSSFALFGLRKYAADIIPAFAEVLQQPAFLAHELEVFQQTNVQELLVELEKVEVRAYRLLTERLFGEAHPYGYNSMPADYLALTREDLVGFYEQHFRPENCLFFASGRVDAALIDLLNQHFGQVPLDTTYAPVRAVMPPPPSPTPTGTLAVAQPDSLQSAIKIGRRMFGRQHPDFQGLVVLNTLLGGYFGSRLMANIREKKGFTYNIYSSFDALQHDGYWYIGTEVNRDKKAATLRAIWAEMKKLREQLVADDELEMVRNYLLGLLLTSLDGPINTADVVRMIAVENIGHEGFAHQIEVIRTITPERLRELARQYLVPDDFLVVTVG
jgi:zinc protease